MKIVILAAGMGSRLGNPLPKPLTVLKTGDTIMGLQLSNIGKFFDMNDVMVVVGFKKEVIMEAYPDSLYVYNPEFDQTNTSKSLLRALKKSGGQSVMWLNGDVVFSSNLFSLIVSYLLKDLSFVCVNNQECGEEEVKYTLAPDGTIAEISKKVSPANGEAVGINYISQKDLPFFVQRLEECDNNDYFERGIELMILKDKRKVYPVDISSFPCMEVDFREDLENANKLL
jgi:L-glutamine-phosphate cytidylyltransferase